MRYISDLHIHSYYSRATSQQLNLEHLNKWGQIKGLRVIGTGDITHPKWFDEIQQKLKPTGNGLFKLKDEFIHTTQSGVPKQCTADVYFMLSGEISSIYKKDGCVRKNHNVVFFSTFDAVERFQKTLDMIGNIHSDGRPILGLDARDLLEIVLETDPHGQFIPAHVWTPWFSLFGSKSGFDRIEDCFEDLTPHIFALETGLSSDPPMNWRLSSLDRFALVSNSDAHSPAKLAREANVFDTDLSYAAMFDAIKTGNGFWGTIEFFPEEGKYHMDGHRKCQCRTKPAETIANNNLCPVCGKPATLGVNYRVEELADRPEGFRPENAKPFLSLIPLPEVLSEVLGVGPTTKRVNAKYFAMLNELGSELEILINIPIQDIAKSSGELVAEAIRRMRQGEVHPEPGFDGEFGVIRIFEPDEREKILNQGTLFTIEREIDQKTKEMPKSAAKPQPKKVVHVREKQASYAINETQDKAIRHRGSPLIIHAGPGTGKTYTLTRHIASLVSTGDAEPATILAITFTNKAAEEMRQRLTKLLGEAANQMTIQTFHACGASLLREQDSFAGRTRDFIIINPAEESAFQKAWQERAGSKPTKAVLEFISRLKSQNLTLETMPQDVVNEAPKNFPTLFQAYEAELQAQNAVDFDDLICLTVRLLRQNPEIRRQVLARYSTIMVDEFQDINSAQYELFRLFAIAAKNVCVIGDPDQAIYGFRGASSSFFTSFSKDFPNAKALQLERNYRSAQNILSASLQLLGRQESEEQPYLWSHIAPEVKVRIETSPTERAEAEFIVHHIEQLVGGTTFFSLDSQRVDDRGLPQDFSFGDFAILMRTRRLAPPIIEALIRSGIPFQHFQDTHLGQHPFVSLVRQTFRFILNPSEHFSFADLNVFNSEQETKLFQQEIHYKADELDTADIVDYLYQSFKNALKDSETLSLDYKKIKELALTFRKNTQHFLDALMLQKEVDELDDRADRVRLMTLHASKGLEFPVVFIAGCEDGIIPHMIKGQRTDINEERRLLYVGMTRAKRYLYLTHAKKRTLFGQTSVQAPSQFLSRISETLLEREKRQPRRRQKRDDQLKLF